MQVTGQKEIVLFAPTDSGNLYRDEALPVYSNIVVARDATARNREAIPDLWKCTPYVTQRHTPP